MKAHFMLQNVLTSFVPYNGFFERLSRRCFIGNASGGGVLLPRISHLSKKPSCRHSMAFFIHSVCGVSPMPVSVFVGQGVAA